MKRLFLLFSLGIYFLSLSPVASGPRDDPALRLAIGDPRYKDKTLNVRPGEIFSAKRGGPVSFEVLAKDLSRVPFVYIGETHNSLPVHDIQLRLLQALYAQNPSISVGLEMFPASSQEILAQWTQNLLTEEEFLRQARWYVVWNYHWGFYRRILDFAREKAIPLRALNVAREVITKVRMRGWEALSDEEKALVPQPDLSNQDHRELMKVVFSSEELPPQMKGAGFDAVFEGLYRAQAAWDEVMAVNTLRASEEGKRRVVVLAGSGHLLFNLGINRRVFEKNRQPFQTVVCLTVPQGQESVTVSRSLADFVWGLPEEEKPAYPSIGLRLKTVAGLGHLIVESKPVEGAALGQDFDKGDIILEVDGKPFHDINELRMYLAGFTWGQDVKFRLLRNGDVKEVVLKIVPPPPQLRSPVHPREG